MAYVRLRIYEELIAAGFDDLQPAHLEVLQAPGPDGRRPIELARAGLMSKQAMNRLIQSLEQRGYLERTAAEHDGRGRIVRLTERGQGATAVIRKTAAEIERELAVELGRERLDALKRELAELGKATASWRDPYLRSGADAWHTTALQGWTLVLGSLAGRRDGRRVAPRRATPAARSFVIATRGRVSQELDHAKPG